MALDEATLGLLAQLAAAGPPIHLLTPPEARAATRAMAALYGAGPEMVAVEDVPIAVAGGHALARVLRPTPTPTGVLVYLHGGGWVIGSADEYDTLARVLAARTGFTTILVEYRKAPEHPYPTAVDDCWAALAWAEEHRGKLAEEGAPLVLAGDSAGGNLAAVMTLRARAAGGPRIDGQVLVYPVTDCAFDTASYQDPANQLMLDRTAMEWFWNLYAPDAASRQEVEASPGRAQDLSGLPPAIVLTAEHDVLRDEGERYAERLAAAGVAVRHRRFAGQMHGFFPMVGLLPGSAEGIDYVVTEVAELLATTAR